MSAPLHICTMAFIFSCRCCASDSVAVFSSCVSTKIEKEKREHAKQHGMIRTEITGAEIAEEMEKERRLFQLQMCEVRANVAPLRNPSDTR